MASIIRVYFKDEARDTLGERVKEEILKHLKLKVDKVGTVEVYTIDKELSYSELEHVRKEIFTDPLVQISSCKSLTKNFDWLVEVGCRPGVTDPVGHTAREAIEELLGVSFTARQSVYASREYLISGGLKQAEVERIVRDFLANELIQRWKIIDRRTIEGRGEAEPYIPHVQLSDGPQVIEVNLGVSDAELERIGKDGIMGKEGSRGPLALSLPEMRTIRDYFNRGNVIAARKEVGLGKNPLDIELESIAQTQSEHCKHKIFNGLLAYEENGKREPELIDSLFKTYIKGATHEIRKKAGENDWCVQVFTDNSGIVRFNENWNLTFKVETHNSPSALDPYGGAITGIVGVNRDPLGTGKGSRLILNIYGYCLAPPNYEKELPCRDKNGKNPLLHPRRILDGVRKGVEDGGNKSGIPTAWGFLRFDERYLGKPLVYVGTVGIMPAVINGKPSHKKKAMPGDLIVMVGGKIGKDGIHGATFSSESLQKESPAAAVQIGDPITQKKMSDMLLEARDLDLYNSITDNGAGGLSCSIGEMAQESGGCTVNLTAAPLKYDGLDPWEIWISEAQERMTLAIEPEKLTRFMELCHKWDVIGTVLGKFTDSGKCHVEYQGKTVMFVDLDFLHNGLPQKRMRGVFHPPSLRMVEVPPPQNLTGVLKEMLSRLNICSKEHIVRQYDHEVQGTSVIKPLVGVRCDVHSDAVVIKPLADSWQGVSITTAIKPNYSDLDTYHMAACCIDEAVKNAISIGSDPNRIALLDNFCWSRTEEEWRLGELKRAAQACYDYAILFGTPFISGKDSMFNDFDGFSEAGKVLKIAVPPTLLISAIGIISDVRKCITMDGKAPEDIIYILGETALELGGSEYLCLMGEEHKAGRVPVVNGERAKLLYQRLYRAIEEGIISSAHSLSDGGLGVGLAKVAFAGELGMEVDLSKVPRKGVERDDFLLFSESASRFIITVSPKNARDFQEMMRESECASIGCLRSNGKFAIKGLDGRVIISARSSDLKQAYKGTEAQELIAI
ncbi:phosphoribosylformylglycinamidine synthase [candidate division NPL-UPA2 bacterium Unc8]|uniref:Phosphoribosylformylglycinamidine synthase subunit PurL n=1 Tax=candidate division NPL-UPA2 bacterium Unc8 TaxID=1980939 RepID=A0A399FYE6_UNCN2|nr:Phosphoribosylformylglycinamidine synthase subunit PurL [Bacillota bacterium]MBT9146494.1 Phosphoribosylformylglycinamidine synthase subunit PurL [Bacillota bacterium]RII01127.1 MAG: phosphoribosylformylglycinamidine synthase [candidate division NPL-UPA2 bacterium Unc8]